MKRKYESRFLSAARTESGLTRKELGQKLGFDGQFLFNMETGRSSLPRKHIKAFIRHTRCDKAALRKAILQDIKIDLDRWFV